MPRSNETPPNPESGPAGTTDPAGAGSSISNSERSDTGPALPPSPDASADRDPSAGWGGTETEREPAEPPARFGRYEVRRRLGRGSFGAVYLAQDTQLGRPVAVKVPHIHLYSQKVRQDFLNEARQLAQLRHPGIVTVFDVGVQDGHCFIVSEYVEGPTLSAWLKRARPPWHQSVRIAADLARALAHAHANRIVHRDLKPGNVILTGDLRPVVVDFGLAVSEIRGTADQRGVVAGTPAYMAPEQVRGEGHRIDGRTDIYALGVILYLMLTGRPPFTAPTTAELFRQIGDDEPQPPRQLVPGLPRDLEAVCLKAMAKSIGRRYTTADDLADDLEGLLRPSGADWAKSTETFHPDAPAVPPDPAPPPSPPSPAEPGSSRDPAGSSGRRPREAERRRLTVLQCGCDIYTSAAVAELLDPEEQLEALAEFQQLARAVAEEHGGTFVQATDDGVLTCFGYPVALEDAAPRAVRAALRLVDRLGGFNDRLRKGRGVTLSAAAAVHSDLAIVEEKPAGGAAVSIVGHVRHVAAQMLAAAEPGAVLVSRDAHALVRARFDCRPLGAHPLRGGTGSVEVFRAVAERETPAEPGPTPLVGRDREIGLLQDRWELAAEGTGQVVLLTGDPGIGKSRLVHDLKEHIHRAASGGAAPVVEWRCAPEHQNTALYPATECLGRALGFDHDTPAADRLARLTGYFAGLGLDAPEDVALLAGLLSLPAAAEGRSPQMTPEVRKERTLRLLGEWLRALAGRGSLLFVVEDLHWADPTTLEFLGPFADRVEAEPILAVLSARPEFEPPWGASPHQTQIALTRLTKRQAADMIRARAGAAALPPAVVDQVVARTDGVPLFVEEFTRMVLERGPGKFDPESSGSGSSRSHEVPATLQDLLAARLDRMASNPEVLQLAAAAGREFSYDLIRAVCPLPEPELRAELAKLVAAELLFERGRPPRTQYTFKHALIQDAAYGALPKKKRQQLHQRIAAALEAEFPEAAGAQPELLAYHYTEADRPAEAVEYLERAGERALVRSAHKEAIGHLTLGLTLLEKVPPSAARDDREVRMRIRLGVPLQATRGYSAPEVQENYARAYDVCQRTGQVGPLFQVLYGLFRAAMLRADYPRAQELGERLVGLANRDRDPGFVAAANRALGGPLVYQGKNAEALTPLRRVLAVHPTPELRAEAYRSDVVDPWVTSGSYLSWVYWLTGRPGLARAESERTVRSAEGLGHPFSVALAVSFSLWLHQFRGDVAACRVAAARAQAVAEQYGFAFWVGWRKVMSGWVTAESGDPAAGAAEIREGIAEWRAQGSELGCHYYLTLLAEAEAAAGRVDDALRTLDEAQAFSDRTGEAFWAPELLRVRGELLLRRDPAARAEAAGWFQRAVDRAREQQALALELRAALSLARVWREGRADDARALVRSVAARFPEGLDGRDGEQVAEFLA